jgi:uncharacterized protein YbaA (DUF1428 family)
LYSLSCQVFDVPIGKVTDPRVAVKMTGELGVVQIVLVRHSFLMTGMASVALA